jgi:tetratricopeptide (TPR) repeat protein
MRSKGKSLLIAGFGFTLAAVPAIAQEQPSSYPPACEASRVSKSDVERAHTVYLSGKQYLEESNYDKAISYFKDAYSIDCSVHGILPVIATAYERKGDKSEAIRALEEYVKRAPNASDHEVIERRIKNLKDQLPREQPSATAPGASAAPVPSGGATAGATLETASAAPPTTIGAPTEAPAAEHPSAEVHTVLPWVFVGLGGAAAIGGAVFYLVGFSEVSSAEGSCPTRQNCSKDVASQGNNGRSLETVGAIVGGVGLAAIAAGLVWHFSERVVPVAVASKAVPVLAPGYGGFALVSAF